MLSACTLTFIKKLDNPINSPSPQEVKLLCDNHHINFAYSYLHCHNSYEFIPTATLFKQKKKLLFSKSSRKKRVWMKKFTVRNKTKIIHGKIFMECKLRRNALNYLHSLYGHWYCSNSCIFPSFFTLFWERTSMI